MISDGSDVEEIVPPPIAHNQATSMDEALIATLASPVPPPPALPGQDALSSILNILNEEDVSPAPIHPSEVACLLLPGLSLASPPLPSLAAPDLRAEEIQVHWNFKKDRNQAAKVAEALHMIVRAQHQKHATMNLWVQSRINGMLAMCHLFSSPSLKHTWTEASELAAKAWVMG